MSIFRRIQRWWNRRYLIRYDGMGDALWIEPVLANLASNYDSVVVVTHHNDLFQHYPHKNVQFQYRLKKREKIWMAIEKKTGIGKHFINLNGAYEQKPKQLILQTYIDEAGINIPQRYPAIYLDAEEQKKRLYPQKYVLLHLENSSHKNYRSVFGVNWEHVVEYIESKGYKVLQIGKAANGIKNAVQFATATERELIWLVNQCSFFIGLDSGPSHIATALGKPALIFFGSVNPLFRHIPALFKGYFLQQYCEFAGCYHDVISTNGQVCRLVGNEGIPKCSLHTDEYIIGHIDKLINAYLK